ncbi:MAG: type II toxin-antitoxin system VapC family toxin [Solirubrobacteraceae bacterium]
MRRPRSPVLRAAFLGARPVAPQHVDVEVLSALRALVRRDEVKEQRALRALDRLATAAIQRIPLGPLLVPAWRLRENLSAYDALYVVLAQQLRCPLLTADRRLAGAPGLGIAVTVVDA